MNQSATPQIALAGKRPQAIVYALAAAMKEHDKPFVLQMQHGDRQELRGALQLLAQRLNLGGPIMIEPTDDRSFLLNLTSKKRDLLAIISGEALTIDQQQMIIEQYMPSKARTTTYSPAGLVIIADRDPGELMLTNLWSKQFTEFKHFTIRWDPITSRGEEIRFVFASCLQSAAVELKIALGDRVKDDGLRIYMRMQRFLTDHAKRAEERGMTLKAHATIDEVYQSARDIVLYIGDKRDRTVNADVVQAIVFKGVTEAALKQTFGLAEPKARKSRASFGPDAPYLAKTASGE